jgi:hypothetical protein
MYEAKIRGIILLIPVEKNMPRSSNFVSVPGSKQVHTQKDNYEFFNINIFISNMLRHQYT